MRPGGIIQPILHRAQHIQPLPVNQQTLCYYVAYLAKHNLSPATIKFYLSALWHQHIASNVPELDRAKMQKLKIVRIGITHVSALKTKETHTRLPITSDILRRIYRLAMAAELSWVRDNTQTGIAKAHNSNCRRNKKPTMPSQCSSSLLCHKRGHTRTTIPTGKWSTSYEDTLYP